MPYSFSYTATIVAPNGETFSYSGSQSVSPAAATPVAADFSAATASMATDIQAKIAAQFPQAFFEQNTSDALGGDN